MQLNKELVTKGMYLSGVANIGGALIFSKFFTNTALNEADPVVMSNFGLLMIVVWGLVFLAMASRWEQLKWLIGAFAVEKFIYGLVWTKWMLHHDLAAVYEADTMAGIFYTIYGPNDWLFCLFYLAVFVYLNKSITNEV
jgi:hypothetical protein